MMIKCKERDLQTQHPAMLELRVISQLRKYGQLKITIIFLGFTNKKIQLRHKH